MVLVKNVKLLPVFILVKIGQENVLDDILEWIKTFLELWKHEVKDVEKLGFFRRVSEGSMVLVKKYNFCYLLILGKISRENLF